MVAIRFYSTIRRGLGMYAVALRQKAALLGALVALVLPGSFLLLATPKASASMSECAAGWVCIWAKSGWSGLISGWPVAETGCHNHEKNATFRSLWNRTNKNV